jgi:DNA-binding transcriptional ArsR family regulator
MPRSTDAYRQVLWHLLAATRGGPTRLHLLALLRARPRNTNQLAVDTGLDYKTIEHHLRVLRENRIVAPDKDGYGALYRLTPAMELHLDEFERIASDVLARAPSVVRPSEGPA